MTTIVENQERETQVKAGIEFLLSHFEGRQRLFPRKMSTFASKGKQFIVYNKEQILNECIKSDFKDCRLNAYPIIEDELLQAPNVIFIDLDLQSNSKELNKNLEKILKIIKQKLNGFEPTVLWTGNGYHIYLVLDVRPLELIEELRDLSIKPSEQFLRFTESGFTNDKKDSLHNPSFQSCLLRIPGTSNSKNGSEVTIIQSYDKNNIPTINNHLLREFRLYLADNDIRRKTNSIQLETKKKYNILCNGNGSNNIPKCYQWIEDKLLETPILDYRKITVDLVLVPYFIVIKKFTTRQTFHLTKEYLIKCDELRPLTPSVKEFEKRIKIAIENKIPPIKIKNMRTKYSQWYNFFNQWNIL
jgi:hypothetical protein